MAENLNQRKAQTESNKKTGFKNLFEAFTNDDTNLCIHACADCLREDLNNIEVQVCFRNKFN